MVFRKRYNQNSKPKNLNTKFTLNPKILALDP